MSQTQPTSYRISDDPEQVRLERERLAHLSSNADGPTFRKLDELGIALGWHCLEVGAGSGTVACFMAERVGRGGAVVSIDIDVRFHAETPTWVEVRKLDLTSEPLERDAFDLVHARALLQHLPEREAVLDKMVAALRPGGRIALQDSDWSNFERQFIPEPFATLSRTSLERSVNDRNWDPYCGSWLLPALRARGLVKCEARGRVYTMRGGQPNAEWYVGGLARSRKTYIDDGTFTTEFVDEAIAQARDPEFAILSPLSIMAWGQRSE
jgi:SAM-dependent methyltransferase